MRLCVIVLLLQFIPSFSQTIVDRAFDTHYKTFKNSNQSPIVNYSLEEYNDSLLSLSFYLGDSTNNRVLERNHYLVDHNLQVLDTINVWNRGNKHVPFRGSVESGIATGIVNNIANQQRLRCYIQPLNDSLVKVELFTVLNKFDKDSLVFSTQLPNRFYVMEPYLNGNTLVLLSAGGDNVFFPDTTYVESYDLYSGQLLGQRKMDMSNMNLKTDFNATAYRNPNQYLSSDSLFYIEYINGPGHVLVLNINDLSTVKKAGVVQNEYVDSLLFVDYGVGSMNGYAYYVDSTGVEVAGLYKAFSVGQGSGSDQFGLCKIGWNDSIHYINQFGDRQTDEYALGYFRTDSMKYLVGSTPKTSNLFPVNTQIMLVSIDSSGYDSLLIYGNKNHRAEQLLQTKDGDIFIASLYSNAWSDSSIYVQLTKISSAVFNHVAKQNISSKITLYPNPTNQYLSSDSFKKGDIIKVYNVNGALIMEESIGATSQIDVGSLKEGTYLLQLIKENKRDAILFIKQE